MSHSIPNDWFFRIKAATRDLIKTCGGVVRAAEIANVSKSEVSRWQVPNHPDIIPLTALLALEGDCGLPLMTAVMAQLNGRELSDPEGTPGQTPGIAAQHSEAVIAAAHMMATGITVFADGKLTPSEAELLDRSAANVERAIAPLRRDLAGAKSPKLKVV